MNRFKNHLITAAVLSVLAVIGTLMNSHKVAAQGPPSGMSVNIVNPLPVPVTGSTTVSGTVAATQSGAWNVGLNPGTSIGVTGTPNVNVANSPQVQVGNSASSPVFTRAVDNPGLAPFQFNQAGGFPEFSFIVPTGKTLVIETVSIACLEPVQTAYFTDFRIFTTVDGVSAQYTFAPTQIPAYGLITNQLTRIYAGPNSTVSIGSGGGVPSGSNCDVTIGGHLVSAL